MVTNIGCLDIFMFSSLYVALAVTSTAFSENSLVTKGSQTGERTITPAYDIKTKEKCHLYSVTEFPSNSHLRKTANGKATFE